MEIIKRGTYITKCFYVVDFEESAYIDTINISPPYTSGPGSLYINEMYCAGELTGDYEKDVMVFYDYEQLGVYMLSNLMDRDGNLFAEGYYSLDLVISNTDFSMLQGSYKINGSHCHIWNTEPFTNGPVVKITHFVDNAERLMVDEHFFL